VVLEITENATDRFPDLVAVLRRYSRHGFTIALDDWGAEHSNFDRLAHIMPSIVKFDAKFLWRAASDPGIADIFCSAVSMVSKLGMQVIAEGVETVEHLYLALDAGCPMIQGFLLGRPGPDPGEPPGMADFLSGAFAEYLEGRKQHLIRSKKRVNAYARVAYRELAALLEAGNSGGRLLECLEALMDRHPEVRKAYVLNARGIQVSPNLLRDAGGVPSRRDMAGRDWSWRPYYIQSLVNRELFGSLYTVTGPYLDPEAGVSVHTVCVLLGQAMVCMDCHEED